MAKRNFGMGDFELLRQSNMQGMARIARVIRRPSEIISRPFLNGANLDMNVNGSITPVDFKYTALEPTLITKLQGVIVDGGISPELFGGIPELTTGITIHAHNADGSQMADLSGFIKANWQFSLFSAINTEITQGVGNQDLLEFGIDLAASGTTLLLETGQYLDVNINDDLTGLTQMRVSVLGYTLKSLPPKIT